MSKITINLGGWQLALTALLCILKLIGILPISWWWCFCLFWLPFAILLALLGLVFIIAIIVMLCVLITELIKILKE